MQARMVESSVQLVLQYVGRSLHLVVLDGLVHEDVFPGGLREDEGPLAFLLQFPYITWATYARNLPCPHFPRTFLRACNLQSHERILHHLGSNCKA